MCSDSFRSLLTLILEYSAYDNNPWTNKLVAFIKEILNQDRVRIIGVCYGHQIVGRAMGVKCAPSNRGWEVSVSKVDLTEEGKKLFQRNSLVSHTISDPCIPLILIQSIMQMHKDIVYDYPPLVEKLGSSSLCEVQGMHIPRRLITVQGHPEFDKEIMVEILKGRRDQGILDENLFQDAISRAGHSQDGLDVAATFLRFMKDGR